MLFRSAAARQRVAVPAATVVARGTLAAAAALAAMAVRSREGRSRRSPTQAGTRSTPHLARRRRTPCHRNTGTCWCMAQAPGTERREHRVVIVPAALARHDCLHISSPFAVQNSSFFAYVNGMMAPFSDLEWPATHSPFTSRLHVPPTVQHCAAMMS